MNHIPPELAALAADHPRAATYYCLHGRLPTFTDHWGRCSSRPTGRPARLLAAVGGELAELRAVTIVAPHEAARIAALPLAAQVPAAVDFMRSDLDPRLGILTAELGTATGWHWHGVVHRLDADDLRAVPGLDVDAPPVKTLTEFTRALRYASKRVKRTAPDCLKWAYADTMLRLMDAMGTTELPELGHASVPTSYLLRSPLFLISDHPTDRARAARLALAQHGKKSLTARALGIPAHTLNSLLKQSPISWTRYIYHWTGCRLTPELLKPWLKAAQEAQRPPMARNAS